MSGTRSEEGLSGCRVAHYALRKESVDAGWRVVARGSPVATGIWDDNGRPAFGHTLNSLEEYPATPHPARRPKLLEDLEWLVKVVPNLNGRWCWCPD